MLFLGFAQQKNSVLLFQKLQLCDGGRSIPVKRKANGNRQLK
jgi:hypothetical protein